MSQVSNRGKEVMETIVKARASFGEAEEERGEGDGAIFLVPFGGEVLEMVTEILT